MTLWGAVTALQTLPTLGSDPIELTVDVGADPPQRAGNLSEGIRALYQKCQFYDMLLVAGDKRFPAHQAVLASLSGALRERLRQALAQTGSSHEPGASTGLGPTEGATSSSAAPSSGPIEASEFEVHPQKDTFHGNNADQLPASDLAACRQACRERGYGAFVVWRGTAYFRSQSAAECTAGLTDSVECTVYVDKAPAGPSVPPPAPQAPAPVGEPQEQSSRYPELQLRDVASAEAVTALLDFVYGLSNEYNISSDEANKDVLRLAMEFELPRLEELATHRLVKGLDTGNAISRLATCEEFGLSSLYDLITEQITRTPEALLRVSNDTEIMKHPKILQSLLVQASSRYPAGKQPSKRRSTSPLTDKRAEKRAKAFHDVAGIGGA